MDLFISLIALIILLPVLVIIALLVKINFGGAVIFKQARPGLNGKIFTIYKFRTMSDAKDEHGEWLPDSERLTRFGRLLRSTSLDELPELINILVGDMSIVGPRPLLVEYLPLYNDHQSRRHQSRPGLTGFAQVNGRNTIGWEEKFNLDVQYIDNISFVGDLKIIFLTVKKVFVREGINSETYATVEKFKGSSKGSIGL
ncbi:sugar transferase [Cohnella sp. GCM10012308]|uniref:sugar transferase n=1 Tax=Cohnella sp. GCM10012308 TaxID=3317329 RepID=UPI00362391A4